jgi:hypothetical protein
VVDRNLGLKNIFLAYKIPSASSGKMFPREEVLARGDNKVSFGFYGTFEDTIVRFISEKMEVGMTKAEIKIFVDQ